MGRISRNSTARAYNTSSARPKVFRNGVVEAQNWTGFDGDHGYGIIHRMLPGPSGLLEEGSQRFALQGGRRESGG